MASEMKIGNETGEITDISSRPGTEIRIDDNLGRSVRLFLDRMAARTLAAIAKDIAAIQARKAPKP